MTDRFAGVWLVTEYVYDPDGRFAGIVRQRRTLQPSAENQTRVTQVCEPEARLAGHPMAGFAGEWVFDLIVDGSRRLYNGPDVVGYGIEWAPGAMTSQGVWPRFGHTFESYAVLVTPERQITGGFFAVAGRSVADIVGVAVPDRGDWPELDLSAEPPEPPLTTAGVHRRAGPLLLAEQWPSPTEQVRTLALSDPPTQHTVTITDHREPGTRRVDVSVVSLDDADTT